jgi:hypothetical protein
MEMLQKVFQQDIHNKVIAKICLRKVTTVCTACLEATVKDVFFVTLLVLIGIASTSINYKIIKVAMAELHCIKNQLIHDFLLITKEEKSSGTALELNDAPSNPQIAVMLYQALCCYLSL